MIFRTADGSRLLAVPYSVSGDSFRAEKPYLWAEGTFGRPNGTRGYDIHPDGKRELLAAYYVRIECGAREAARFDGHIGSNIWRIRGQHCARHTVCSRRAVSRIST